MQCPGNRRWWPFGSSLTESSRCLRTNLIRRRRCTKLSDCGISNRRRSVRVSHQTTNPVLLHARIGMNQLRWMQMVATAFFCTSSDRPGLFTLGAGSAARPAAAPTSYERHFRDILALRSEIRAKSKSETYDFPRSDVSAQRCTPKRHCRPSREFPNLGECYVARQAHLLENLAESWAIFSGLAESGRLSCIVHSAELSGWEEGAISSTSLSWFGSPSFRLSNTFSKNVSFPIWRLMVPRKLATVMVPRISTLPRLLWPDKETSQLVADS
jgi:hypothetical protein